MEHTSIPTKGSRLQVLIRLERLAMTARYAGYGVYAAMFLMEVATGFYMENIAVITLLVVLHNAFVHWVMWTRRYHLFRSPLNFLVHLTEASLVILFTGGQDSDLFVIYLFLLIGYMVYSRRYRSIAGVSVILCVAYSGVLFIDWLAEGVSLSAEAITVRLASILVCGWLVATISDLLRKAEDAERKRGGLFGR